MNTFRIAIFVMLAQATPQSATSVQGTVLKFSVGGPIESARVELIRVDGTAPQSYSGITTSDGSFRIPDVRPGTYRLAASRTGYLRREFGQRSRTASGMVLNLVEGQQLRNLEIELKPAAVITGRVADLQGNPVFAAEVKALVPAYIDEKRILWVVQSTITNDLGEYRLFGLAAGQYYVSATPTDGPVTTLVVSPQQPNQVRTNFGSTSYDAVYYPNTGDSRISTPIDLSNGGEAGGINITISPTKSHHIRGIVPGGTAYVTLVPSDPGLSTNTRRADASDGPFDFANIFPGEYTLIARSGDLVGITQVNMRDDDLDRIIVGLSSYVHAPTRVSFESRTPGENDPDLSLVNMNLLADPPFPGGPPDVYGPFPNGFLAFQVLMRQEYRVTNLTIAEGAPEKFRDTYFKSIRLGNRDVINEGFRVDEPDRIPTMEIVIGLKTGTLTGNVTSEKQKPEVNATVVLVPDGGRRRWANMYRTVLTDLAGYFVIDHIPPGDYIAFSWEEVEDGAWMDPEFMKKYETRGKRVHVNEGGSQTLNITAIP